MWKKKNWNVDQQKNFFIVQQSIEMIVRILKLKSNFVFQKNIRIGIFVKIYNWEKKQALLST
jgi:hypothetical protein